MQDANQSSPETTEPGRPSQPDFDLDLASVISGVIWVILGALLIYFFHEQSVTEIFMDGQYIWLQLLWGISFGCIFGLAGYAMFKNPKLRSVLDDYFIMRQLKEFDIKKGQIIHISLVAGITEEFLFRAAIQPLIGIWLTSLLFIGIHGYIRLKTPIHFFFTLFTFLLSMMLGYLFIYSGIIAAMAAHAVYDMIVLWVVSREKT